MNSRFARRTRKRDRGSFQKAAAEWDHEIPHWLALRVNTVIRLGRTTVHELHSTRDEAPVVSFTDAGINQQFLFLQPAEIPRRSGAQREDRSWNSYLSPLHSGSFLPNVFRGVERAICRPRDATSFGTSCNYHRYHFAPLNIGASLFQPP